ncbi:MAG: hypothetical protein GY778_28800 [bacterium]|nr:hypothetical protein [bacterium]
MDDRVCEVDGCGRPLRARGFCEGHYRRFTRGKPLTGPLRARTPQIGLCEAPGCEAPKRSLGFCVGHVGRYRRGTSLEGPIRQPGPALPLLHFHLRKYGLSVEGFRLMLYAQDGVCLLCRRTDQFGRRLAVDHCHETGEIRGLLCGRCNVALGMLRDDPELLRAAAEYLSRR